MSGAVHQSPRVPDQQNDHTNPTLRWSVERVVRD
jgi:hypothetical protein